MTPLLSVRDLRVAIRVPQGVVEPVRSLSFDLLRGETLCIVGESGCGKSLTSLAIMGLLRPGMHARAECILFNGTDLLKLSRRRRTGLRGDRIAMVFQEPMTSLNPSFTIGNQLEEALLLHRRVSRRAARDRAAFLLDRVGIVGVGHRLGQYPHQLSGGLRQRVMIAMALMCGPDLLIADEPTTALDVTIQAQVLRLLLELKAEFGMTLLLITHDLGVVARVADRVAVMYAGEFVETGPVDQVFANPVHPYTEGLLRCIPVLGRQDPAERLGVIGGTVASPGDAWPGCSFADRCAYAEAICRAGPVAMTTSAQHQSYRCLRPASVRAATPTEAHLH